ncbi:MAG TPA: hypothetical protein VNZ52_14755 [Candidatus Thermoplasmatota archaeon]|nr:hypothetical protein [Candidatus Thermoplasmatota archaeon]
MKRDTVVGIVGAVILLGALVGILYVQAASAPKDLIYTVAWTSQGGALAPVEGTLTDGDTLTERVPVEVANLTEVTFTLTWTDNENSAPDSFTLTVTTPSGRQLPATSRTDGTITVTATAADLNPSPTTGQVAAKDEAEAQRKLAQQHTSTLGQGEWTVAITLDARDNVPATPVGVPVVPRDTGNAFTLNVAYKTYAPTLIVAS